LISIKTNQQPANSTYKGCQHWFYSRKERCCGANPARWVHNKSPAPYYLNC